MLGITNRNLFRHCYKPLTKNFFLLRGLHTSHLIKRDDSRFGRAPRSQTKNTKRIDNSKVEYVPSNTVLDSYSPAAHILSQGAIIITRNIEFMSLLVGFEQSNRYALLDQQGNLLGYMLEDSTLVSMLMRQSFRLHRPFKVTILDANMKPVLRVTRPFSFINSKISVSDMEENLIGETHQEWHLWRRRYNLFTDKTQFARVDAPFLSWQFDMRDVNDYLVASYVLRMDPYILSIERGNLSQPLSLSGNNYEQLGVSSRILTFDQRAVLLANAISIDFDYFSRHSNHHIGPI
ncbi:hypothetical protein BB558_006210 [Smittium angustum]|uniref:Phospholipid scramblase n=1 Tax=Smittium angustum TaxID=133377 RepID=A0A2U1IYC1_SMIAN|nr:hypothetical protein BB558_006210 [Smittium angustum]